MQRKCKHVNVYTRDTQTATEADGAISRRHFEAACGHRRSVRMARISFSSSFCLICSCPNEIGLLSAVSRPAAWRVDNAKGSLEASPVWRSPRAADLSLDHYPAPKLQGRRSIRGQRRRVSVSRRRGAAQLITRRLNDVATAVRQVDGRTRPLEMVPSLWQSQRRCVRWSRRALRTPRWIWIHPSWPTSETCLNVCVCVCVCV